MRVDDDGAERACGLGGSDLAAKLDKLFDTMHPRGVPPLSNDDVAKGIEAKTGVNITAECLGELRTGEKRNPAVEHLRAIAGFFGVDARYLVEPGLSEGIGSQLDALRAVRDAGVRDVVCARGGVLSPAALLDVARSIERVSAEPL